MKLDELESGVIELVASGENLKPVTAPLESANELQIRHQDMTQSCKVGFYVWLH
ncbi:MAG: hypothetical protein GY696_36960 [Gammaproteobacteria bacterium]|nr:hypothetical protein [Gammaproteobacteria bacterium]